MSSKYRHEVRRLKADIVDLVSRNAEKTTIPIPWEYTMEEVLEVANILDNLEWEVLTTSDNWVWFKRYVEGSYKNV